MYSAEYFVVRLNTAFGKNENVVFHLSTKYDIILGAAGRSRTDTVSLPLDFESSASANFTTAAFVSSEFGGKPLYFIPTYGKI